jgi:hypothetical protein
MMASAQSAVLRVFVATPKLDTTAMARGIYNWAVHGGRKLLFNTNWISMKKEMPVKVPILDDHGLAEGFK